MSIHLYGLERLASIDGSGTQTWEIHDALGSVRQHLAADGSVVPGGSYAYTPFGVVAGGNTPVPFGFTGELHSEGLVYLRARWYDASGGTFTSRDPFAGFPTQPYSLHPYQYGYSDPILWADPSGLQSIPNATPVITPGPGPVSTSDPDREPEFVPTYTPTPLPYPRIKAPPPTPQPEFPLYDPYGNNGIPPGGVNYIDLSWEAFVIWFNNPPEECLCQGSPVYGVTEAGLVGNTYMGIGGPSPTTLTQRVIVEWRTQRILSFLPGGWQQMTQVKEIVTNINQSIIRTNALRGIQLRQRTVQVISKASVSSISAATGLNILFSAGLQGYSDYTTNPCRSPREFVTRAGVAGGFAIAHSGMGLLGTAAGETIGGGVAGPPGVVVGGVVGGLGGSTISILLLEEVTFFNGRSLKGVVLYQVSPSEHIGQP